MKDIQWIEVGKEDAGQVSGATELDAETTGFIVGDAHHISLFQQLGRDGEAGKHFQVCLAKRTFGPIKCW